MNRRLTNDENIENLKKRKILRIVIIVFSVITILLAIGSIFFKINVIFPILTYLVVAFSSKKRNNTIINKKKSIYEVEKEINKIKKHKK